MPTTLTFTDPLNVSCQVGDTVYYVPTATTGNFSTAAHSGIIEIGIITTIVGLVITVANNLVASVPSGAFILFSKDNKANMSSALGYYAEVKIKNDSEEYAEMFSFGVEIFESSK
jgi:hypothetical protein|tara:strand:+ start:422 stop:766 length:345 start_codon:yes stop_codon:yes gene_type:complete